MKSGELAAILAGLKSFQRDAVQHVAHQFFQSEGGSDRFLIADETGLGKSVVARGIIAETVHALEQDPNVESIDIVYICSNQDLAQQNLERLNITGREGTAVATRLTLLARELARKRLGEKPQKVGPRNSSFPHSKPVNLTSFTPGTSFASGSWRQGNADERALIVLLLDDFFEHTSAERHATRVMFRGAVKTVERFSQNYVEPMRASLGGGVDPQIRSNFMRILYQEGLHEDFVRLRNRIVGNELPEEIWHETQDTIAGLRNALAKAGVETLKPNLVILDEFQRFRPLLSPDTGGEAAELANALFGYANAKVLLLSATPYKPFTRDAEDGDGEGHYEDFLKMVEFLFREDRSRVRAVEKALANYRESLVIGGNSKEAAGRVREVLLPVMSRSERPSLVRERDLVQVRVLDVPAPTNDDLSEWMSLSSLGELIEHPVNLEYWKSIPYFASFMGTYSAGRKVKECALGPRRTELDAALRQTRSLTSSDVARFKEIDPGNGPLRALMAESIDQGWWKLLWIPPSMPYLKPGGPFKNLSPKNVTKHVLFSSWAATPLAVAGILSHEASRRMHGVQTDGMDEPEHVSQRLNYALRDGRAAGLSTLALFWPHPRIVEYTDQLEAARTRGRRLEAEELTQRVELELPSGRPAAQAHEAFFRFPGAFDAEVRDIDFLGSEDREQHNFRGLLENIEEAHRISHSAENKPSYHPDLARIAAFSPGSVSYRAVSTIAGSNCSPSGKWRAAFTISEGLRTLFNRPDVQALLDNLSASGELGSTTANAGEDDRSSYYWQKILDYCADGNLRAVLDEYLFQLWSETGQQEVDDELLLSMARKVAESLNMRMANRFAHEATLEREPIPMPLRFAVPYSAGETSSGESASHTARQSAVRAAFNSPFAPFVLTTTSVGQEGIDFHWWSHSVVHWNLPANPVDFEQREGRVNRYGGHVVRKNVAQQHWEDVLLSDRDCAWQVAFEAAENTSFTDTPSATQTPSELASPHRPIGESGLDAFSPWWVYPGDAQVQRVLVQYPFSRDIEKYEQLKSALVLYRLTLGQPRQEDMVEMMQRRGIEATETAMIDLRPPSFRHGSTGGRAQL